jgi:hypothetical protein
MLRIINSVNKMIHNVAGWLYEEKIILFRQSVFNFESAIAE